MTIFYNNDQLSTFNLNFKKTVFDIDVCDSLSAINRRHHMS